MGAKHPGSLIIADKALLWLLTGWRHSQKYKTKFGFLLNYISFVPKCKIFCLKWIVSFAWLMHLVLKLMFNVSGIWN